VFKNSFDHLCLNNLILKKKLICAKYGRFTTPGSKDKGIRVLLESIRLFSSFLRDPQKLGAFQTIVII